jgi:LEA14-like dessication related protein
MTNDMENRFGLWLTLFSLVVLTSVLGLGSCATLDQIIQKPTATFSHMTVNNADLMKANIVFSFNVANPNPINIRANRITYDLKLNGRNFIAGQLDQGMTLAGGSTSQLSIPVTMQYLDFFESLTQMWKAKGADYALTGGFSVGPFRIPYQARGNFDLPKMPKFSLETIRVEDLSLSGARLNCRLKMANPNAFDLLFKRLVYNLNLGGTSFAKASALTKGPIAGKSNSVMDFALDVSFAELGMSAYQLLTEDKSDFTINGGMVLDSPEGGEHILPFKLAGRIPLSR